MIIGRLVQILTNFKLHQVDNKVLPQTPEWRSGGF